MPLHTAISSPFSTRFAMTAARRWFSRVTKLYKVESSELARVNACEDDRPSEALDAGDLYSNGDVDTMEPPFHTAVWSMVC